MYGEWLKKYEQIKKESENKENNKYKQSFLDCFYRFV